jgi:biofilm PGA synthesis N-glycosyltransferase PgaC
MKSFNLAMEILFWSSLGLVVYAYCVYPAVLFVGYSLAQLRSDWLHLFGGRDRRVPELPEDAVPKISFVIPAYNEGDHLLQKLANLSEMDYPREKLQIIVVSD